MSGWINSISRMLGILVLATVGFVSQADDDAVISQVSFLGGAGATATNGDYAMVSSWRQQTQTLVSTGGGYVNVSGFLAAISDMPGESGFRIISVETQTSPTNLFKLTIPTTPGSNYVVQFTDILSVSGVVWVQFQNTNEGVGRHFETNTLSSTFTFVDDFTADTSGGPPTTSSRYYRVAITPP